MSEQPTWLKLPPLPPVLHALAGQTITFPGAEWRQPPALPHSSDA